MSTRGDLPRIARLAGLHFTEAELDLLADELDEVLARVAELDQVEVVDVSVLRGASTAAAALRPDVAGSDELAVPPSYLAPEWREGFFTVPRLPTHSDRE